MFLAKRPFLLLLAIGMTVAASVVSAQQDPPTVDPFGLSEEPQKTIVIEATSGPAQETPADDSVPDKEAANSHSFHGVSIQHRESIPHARIARALDQSVDLEFVDTPLSAVVDFLQSTVNIPIVIDNRALDDIGLGADTPVTCNFRGISLRSVLRLMLGELELTYVARNEVLQITTPEEAENQLDVRFYEVSDFAYQETPSVVVTDPGERFALLEEIITSVVAPDTWDTVGGAGNLTAHNSLGLIAVSQTDENHQQITALLRTMARAREAKPGQDPGSSSFLAINDTQREGLARIQQALKTEAELRFSDAPLSEIVEFLSTQYQVPFLIDRRALDDVGLGSDKPVTVSLSGISLRSALRLMLEELDLTYVVRDEVITITTPEEAETELLTVIYAVQQLRNAAGGDVDRAVARGNLRDLVSVIVATVAPHSWDDVGGAGVLEVAEPWGLLVVAQTGEVHEKVGGLIATALRLHANSNADLAISDVDTGPPVAAVNPFSGPEEARDEPVDELQLRQYLVIGTIEEISQLIMGTVQPDSWRPGRCTIFPVGNRLVIRQTPEAHKQIAELLRVTGVLVVGKGQMMGGF